MAPRALDTGSPSSTLPFCSPELCPCSACCCCCCCRLLSSSRKMGGSWFTYSRHCTLPAWPRLGTEGRNSSCSGAGACGGGREVADVPWKDLAPPTSHDECIGSSRAGDTQLNPVAVEAKVHDRKAKKRLCPGLADKPCSSGWVCSRSRISAKRHEPSAAVHAIIMAVTQCKRGASERHGRAPTKSSARASEPVSTLKKQQQAMASMIGPPDGPSSGVPGAGLSCRIAQDAPSTIALRFLSSTSTQMGWFLAVSNVLCFKSFKPTPLQQKEIQTCDHSSADIELYKALVPDTVWLQDYPLLTVAKPFTFELILPKRLIGSRRPACPGEAERNLRGARDLLPQVEINRELLFLEYTNPRADKYDFTISSPKCIILKRN
ncbi:Hypothetical predicted protein [Podarcis lilfordi]|uniref:Uncharacterized protein n=1 Tax=Podarcis lilfordi TaxID=74358 RepID=A0AA35KEK4_9SAUR|nr:Hypothetical predicted protein [Podarcis lilfordi]